MSFPMSGPNIGSGVRDTLAATWSLGKLPLPLQVRPSHSSEPTGSQPTCHQRRAEQTVGSGMGPSVTGMTRQPLKMPYQRWGETRHRVEKNVGPTLHDPSPHLFFFFKGKDFDYIHRKD